MITVSALNIYPLKSGAGIPLDAVTLDHLGPENDRRWMIVNSEGRFVSQRELAPLCQIRLTPMPDGYRLEGPGMEPLEQPRPTGTEPILPVRIWSDHCQAADLGARPAEWCSQFLGEPVRLVYVPPSWERRTDPQYDRIGGQVGFADGYPLLLIGEASLTDLNERLSTPLPMNRFRPNVVVRGAAPYAEDEWQRLTIGTIPMDAVKPCARCVITTTDQTTAVRGPEPLRTLARYRRKGSGLMFGVNVVHRAVGIIRVGDPIII